MILKGLILTLIIVLSGFLTFTALILAVVKRKNSSAGKIWFSVFCLSLVIVVSFSVYTFITAANIAVDTTKKAGKKAMESAAGALAEAWTDNRIYLLDSINRNKQVERLKSFVPDSLKDQVPSGFYTCFGFRDFYRFPLVYPYSIHCIDIVEDGRIVDERRVADICRNSHGVKQLQVEGITHFSFDGKLLLAKLSGLWKYKKDSGFIMFHFDRQKAEYFNSGAALMNRAKQLGFSGPDTMTTIKEYDLLFRKQKE